MNQGDARVLLDARTQHVTFVLDPFYTECDRARAGDDPRSAPFPREHVIYGPPHVTVGDWLTEALSSGATALADRETIAQRAHRPEHRVEDAHFTRLSALSTIGALEGLAAQTAEPKLADRQWVLRSTAREAVESWDEIRDKRNGLEYAVASWLACSRPRYTRISPRSRGASRSSRWRSAKWLIRALAWTTAGLAVAEDGLRPQD